MWMEENLGTRINSTRFEQLEVLEPEVIGVACPAYGSASFQSSSPVARSMART